jgi:hypothetical protein
MHIEILSVNPIANLFAPFNIKSDMDYWVNWSHNYLSGGHQILYFFSILRCIIDECEDHWRNKLGHDNKHSLIQN